VNRQTREFEERHDHYADNALATNRASLELRGAGSSGTDRTPRKLTAIFKSCCIPRAHSITLAVALAACIFLGDTLSSLQFAAAPLYVLVILISARDLHRHGIILTGPSCALLTTLSYVLTHGFALDGAAPLRSSVSFVSIVITVTLVVRNVSANERLEEVQRERANLARFFPPQNC
jgi:hypothetical protein